MTVWKEIWLKTIYRKWGQKKEVENIVQFIEKPIKKEDKQRRCNKKLTYIVM